MSEKSPNGTVGFHITNCADIKITDCRSVGSDIGIVAANTVGLDVKRFTHISPELNAVKASVSNSGLTPQEKSLVCAHLESLSIAKHPQEGQDLLQKIMSISADTVTVITPALPILNAFISSLN